MEKKNYVFDAILAVAVVVLFVLHFVGPKQAVSAPVEKDSLRTAIAYVNLDSVLTGYQFAVDANDKLMSKQEDARVKLANKATALQNEYRAYQNEAAAFQQKVDANAFLSRDRAESEYARIQKKGEGIQQRQQELARMEDELTQELMLENQKLNLELRDSLNAYLREFNERAGYQMILGNTEVAQTVLVGEPACDITEEVIAGLNARYVAK